MHPQITVDTARHLSYLDVLDREVAEITAVPIGTIRKWRTGARRGARKARRADCPRCTGRPLDEPAYSYLLGLYLGDGWLTRGRKDVFALNIACCDDWRGLLAAAQSAMSAVMPMSKVFGVQRIGMTEVKRPRSTGRACFRSMGPGGSTLAGSSSLNGSGSSWSGTREISPGGSFIRTATAVLTGCAETGAAATTGTSTRGACSPTTRRTSCGSAGRP